MVETHRSILIFDRLSRKAKAIEPKEYKSKFNVEYLDELHFEDPQSIEKLSSKCKKLLKKSDIKAENDWIRALYETNFRAQKHPRLMIRYINHRLGYGLFAAETIPAFTYIGEYSGVVRKRNRRKDRTNNYVFGYTIAHKNTPFVIDAQDRGSTMRFVNHSDDPNIASHWMIVDNLCHIIFHSTELIPAGAQLTYDYGPYYWRTRTNPKDL